MATSPDHPGLPFVQAAGYTRGRPDGLPLWVVWHSMEASEHGARAESTAAYFANPGDGRDVSSHYCVDNDSVIQCVRLADSAWTVGNRPGNNRGINWELSGFARQTRAEWLDPFGLAMFAQAAPIAAADMTRFAIPNRWCTVDDLIARRPGHTTHNDLRIAFGGTTHTDPGPSFPRDHVLKVIAAALNPQEIDMILGKVHGDDRTYVSDGLEYRQVVNGVTLDRYLSAGVKLIEVDTQAELADLIGVPWTPGSGGGLTPAQIEEAAFQGAQRAERQ